MGPKRAPKPATHPRRHVGHLATLTHVSGRVGLARHSTASTSSAARPGSGGAQPGGSATPRPPAVGVTGEPFDLRPWGRTSLEPPSPNDLGGGGPRRKTARKLPRHLARLTSAHRRQPQLRPVQREGGVATSRLHRGRPVPRATTRSTGGDGRLVWHSAGAPAGEVLVRKPRRRLRDGVVRSAPPAPG